MPRVESGGVTAQWDPAEDVLRMHMTEGCRPGAADANLIADAIERWTGDASPMRVLIDCEGATGLYLQWRIAWTMRITKHQRPIRMAYHNQRSMAAWVMPYFAMMSGIDAKGCPDEAAALEWLLASPEVAKRPREIAA